MINAILSRLKREHSEHKIDIKQVINTQNNNYQVKTPRQIDPALT